MRVGFIGLGTMGASMASNLQKAGHELCVTDLRREAAAPHVAAGAAWKDTPRQVAEGVEVVFTSLPGPPEVEAVAIGADGLIHGMPKGTALLRPLDEFAGSRASAARRVQGEGPAPPRRAGERRAQGRANQKTGALGGRRSRGLRSLQARAGRHR